MPRVAVAQLARQFPTRGVSSPCLFALSRLKDARCSHCLEATHCLEVDETEAERVKRERNLQYSNRRNQVCGHQRNDTKILPEAQAWEDDLLEQRNDKADD